MGKWKGEKSFTEVERKNDESLLSFSFLFICLKNPFSICHTTRLNGHSIVYSPVYLLPLQFLPLSVSLLWIGKPETTRGKKFIFSFTWSYYYFFFLVYFIHCWAFLRVFIWNRAILFCFHSFAYSIFILFHLFCSVIIHKHVQEIKGEDY